MANRTNKTSATINSTLGMLENASAPITFDREAILASYTTTTKTKDGKEVDSLSFDIRLNERDAKTGVSVITTSNADVIESIVGLQNADKLEKWSAYRKGYYLVKLASTSFGEKQNCKSIKAIADKFQIGVDGSTANSLESVARRLGVYFDEAGILHFADDTLPRLSFWAYNNIISLVTENEAGAETTYNYDSLKDFIARSEITPLTSQKVVKELFNLYRNGKLNNEIALPDSVAERAEKDRKVKEEREAKKQEAEKAKAIVSARVAIENAKSFQEKQAVALSALKALQDCMEELAINELVALDIHPTALSDLYQTLELLIVDAVDTTEEDEAETEA